jgi:hypothetical protein
MKNSRYASFALVAFSLAACGSSVSSTPSSSEPPAATEPAPRDDAGATPPREAGAVPGADAAAQRTKGPSFDVSPDKLAIVDPAAPASQSTNYTAALDPSTPESGSPSMLLASSEGATLKEFAATTASLPIPDASVGGRYRLRAKIKTENATRGWLWFRIDGPGFFVLDNMGNPVDRQIPGTTDWQQIDLVLDVPTGATRFAFGSGLKGLGKVWVSAIRLEEVGQDVPTTPHFENGL